MPQLLDEEAVADALPAVPQWTRAGSAIFRTFTLRDFAAAMAFVNRVAELAEQENHHPDIEVRWNSGTLRLTTHSAGGLTALDFRLAHLVNGIGLNNT